ncbi:MAG: hypothetical protein JSV61_15800 [Anaerolineales bacterium]|nr:MAG: hypothetical protein JSV61_15800 [Anaerolineales bacterium]
MGEVRCPMCGKVNPEELEVCRYCEARLKPLLGPIEPADTPEARETQKGAVTDWLDSLREQEDNELNDSPSKDLDIGEDLEEDSLTFMDTEAKTPEEDWLEGLRAENESEVEEESDAHGEHPDWFPDETSEPSDIPEWLSGIQRDDQAEEAVIFDDENRAEQDEAPIFESSIELEGSELEGQDITATFLPQEEGESATQADESRTFEDTPDDDELTVEPDGLNDELVSPPKGETEEQADHLESGEEIPEWLVGFVDGEKASTAELAEEAELEPEQTPEWLAELEDKAGLETPAAANDVENEEAEAKLDVVPTEQLDKEAEFDLLTSPGELQEEPPYTYDDEDVDLERGEVPEWLSGVPAQESEAGELLAEDDDADLAPADLPDWMESMRPVEAAAQAAPIFDKSDQSVESSGPLAGLRGVLPVEPEVAQLKKPSAYAIKLQVSDNQRKHADLFEELIGAEGVSVSVEPGAKSSSQFFLRIIIFLLLLLAVGWPIYTGSQDVELPELARGINEASQIINQLAVSEPVLLAIDYEPGFSGEMDAASAAVVDHLMIRGAYLAIVSSTPTGPAQAERLIKTVNIEAGHAYQAPAQYTNLGYVSGGQAGLLSFAQTPRRVTPFDLYGEPGWETASLENIQTLADFATVIVITDSPETARTWVEQVQPTLADTEMIMVVSAQAEPLVRPYYEGSPQPVRGLVTGLAGGAAYELGMPRTSLARYYWDAFSYGITMTVLLIIVGSTINSISRIMTSRKQTFRNKRE